MLRKIIQILINVFRFVKTIVLPLTGGFLICNAALYSLKFDIGKLKDNDFLFTFFGVVLGFAITIFIFVSPEINKLMKQGLIKYKSNENKKAAFEVNIQNLFKEIKQNIAFVFFSLCVVSFLIATDFKIPSFHLFGKFSFDKIMFANSLKLLLFTSNLIVIYDLVVTSFTMSTPNKMLK